MKYFVSTGGTNLEIDASGHMEAFCQAVEKMICDKLSFGLLMTCSTDGFSDLGNDDDVIILTQNVFERIGFTEKDGQLTRCGICRGVGRIDCCDQLDCEKCQGLFNYVCPYCESEDARQEVSVNKR